MTEVRYATPMLGALAVVVNPINQSIPVNGPGGQRRQQAVRVRPGAFIGLGMYLEGVQVGSRNYSFGDGSEEGERLWADVQEAAGVDIAAAFNEALDEMAEDFPVLVDPVEGDEAKGPAVYLQIDMWRASLVGPNKSIEAHVGFYPTPECDADEVQHYEVLFFADKNGRKEYRQQLATLRERVRHEESVLDGSHEALADMTDEQKAEAVERAEANLAQLSPQFEELKNRKMGSMEDLLRSKDASIAAGALMQGVYSTLIANDPAWTEVDLATVMASFQASMAEVLA